MEGQMTGPVGAVGDTLIDRGETEGSVICWQRKVDAVLTSIATDTEAGKQAYLACLAAPARYARQCVGDEIRVVEWFVHMVERVDEVTGEVNPGLRLVFVRDDGTTIATSSRVLIDNWGHIVKMYGMQRFDPPLLLRLSASKGRNGGEYLQIASVTRHVTPKPKTK